MTLIQQQRLIGAILLVCVFSGIAYFLMSSANQTDEPISESIAPKEAFTSSIEAIDNDIEVISEQAEALVDPHNLKPDDAVAPAKPVIADKPEIVAIEKAPLVSEPVVTKKPKETTQSWFLQLASFSVKKNAQTLQKDVAALGYDAKIQSSNSAKGTIYRVRIGPETSKKVLESASVTLSKKLKLKPQIVQNSP